MKKLLLSMMALSCPFFEQIANAVELHHKEYFTEFSVAYNKNKKFENINSGANSIIEGMPSKGGAIAEISFGRYFNKNIYSTVSFDIQNAVYKNGASVNGVDFQSSSKGLLLGAGLDFKNHSSFTPFVFAGIGMAQHSTKNFEDINANNSGHTLSYSGTKSYSPAWKISAGIKQTMTSQIDLTYIASYYDYGKAKTTSNEYQDGVLIDSNASPIGTRISGASFGIGIRFKY